MSNQAFLNQLQQDVATVHATITTAGLPSNEAQTESLVIDPILKALGYAPTDYVKQGFSSATRNFPDYIILPNNSHKWILEVKKYSHALTQSDENQATNYGFHGATEWAVLTNGQKWYIYNIPLQNLSRRVLQIDNLFADKNALQLLSCLSRQGMLEEQLKEAWKIKRVTTFVAAEMIEPDSLLRVHLCQTAKQKLGLDVTDDAIGNVLAAIIDNQPALVLAAGSQVSSTAALPTMPTPVATNLDSTNFYTFGEILANPLLGTKQRPKTLEFGDGHRIAVNSWANAAQVVVAELGSKYSLPVLPFTGGSNGKSYFLNVTATHSDGSKMRSSREAQVNSVKVYIDTHRNVKNMSARLVIFLNAIHAPLDAVKIGIKS